MTAVKIQNSSVTVETYSDAKGKKYGFIISRMENGHYRMEVSSNPVYDDENVAREDGEALVKEIKSKTLEELTTKPYKEETVDVEE